MNPLLSFSRFFHSSGNPTVGWKIKKEIEKLDHMSVTDFSLDLIKQLEDKKEFFINEEEDLIFMGLHVLLNESKLTEPNEIKKKYSKSLEKRLIRL